MDPTVDAAFVRVRVMTVAFMASVAVYVVVAIQLRVADSLPEAGAPDSVLWTLRGALAFLSIAGLLAVDRVQSNTPVVTPEAHEDAIPTQARVQRATARAVLRLAFTDAIAVYGLLLFLLGGNFIDLGAFCGAALVVFGARFPTRERWAREAR